MNVLITGAGGQVALQLMAGRPPHARVSAMDRTELDISDRDAVRKALASASPQVIINAAGYTAVDKAEQEPGKAMLANALGPRVLAEAAREMAGCRLIHISSDYVFGAAGGRPLQPLDPTSPLGAYGRSKLAGEHAVVEVLGSRTVLLRTSWVYGGHGRNFLHTMLRLMRAQGAVRVVADQVGTPTSTPALAEVIWAFALRREIAGVYHWSDAGAASWYDFAVAIAEEGANLGLLPADVDVTPIATEDFPTLAVRPAYSVLDKRATVDVLGILPRHWRVRLREVLGSMRNG